MDKKKIPICKCGHNKKQHNIDRYGKAWKCKLTYSNKCSCLIFIKLT